MKFDEQSHIKSPSTIVVDENEKMIILTKVFVSDDGQSIDTYEKFWFVKKETIEETYKYYAVDLENKRYLEFTFYSDSANIERDCNGFTGCNWVTTFLKE
jgi:hypothetical protein